MAGRSDCATEKNSGRPEARRLHRPLLCRSGGVFGSGQIAGDLVLAYVEDDDFVGGLFGGALYIELDGLAGSFVLLLDGFVVGQHGDREPGFFRIGLVQRHLHGTDALRGLGFGKREFVIVAVAAALEFFEVVLIVGNQAAHHAHVPGGAVKFCFGGFQVSAGGFNIFLRAGYVGGYSADLGLAFLLSFGNLLSQFLVGGELVLADGFGAALGFGNFGLGHSDFLGSDVELTLDIGEAGVGLFQLGTEDFVLVLGLAELLLQTSLDGMTCIGEQTESDKEDGKQNGNPARSPEVVIVIGFLR